ncbi:MAG: SWF/SNF helicase family protein [Chitinophagaceae bacterium]|nr:SWF/SNF helicase family protein [Chitinophagaceae bacterium]
MEDEKRRTTLIFEEIVSFREREQKKKDKDFAYRIQQPETALTECFQYRNKAIKQEGYILMKRSGRSPSSCKAKIAERMKGQKVLIFLTSLPVDYIGIIGRFLNEVGYKDKPLLFLKAKMARKRYVQRLSPSAQRQTIIDGKVNGKPELQVLVSTDVLSEGQNLQDCGIIINYDLHWNPVKMIQRNGRINRLGSVFNEVKIHNFLPEGQLERFLKLIKRLQDKIRIIGGSVGIDSSILGEQITDRQFGLLEDIYSGNTERCH